MNTNQIYPHIPFLDVPEQNWVGIKKMQGLDRKAIKKYRLPLNQMMENAGYHLAKMAVKMIGKDDPVLVGCGPGNNGGGGIAAARRLAAWGYDVTVDVFGKLKGEPSNQYKIAKYFGIKDGFPDHARLFIDCYFGFSQKLPLPKEVVERIQQVNERGLEILSLDIPTGISESAKSLETPHFKAEVTLTLAAPKKVLRDPRLRNQLVFLADLGIPKMAYEEEGMKYPGFSDGIGLYQITC